MTIVSDHGKIVNAVDEMAISKFKATCLAALERVRRTGKPLLVTKRGVPVAQVVPPPVPKSRRSTYGAMKDSVLFMGDVIEPVGVEDWEALR